MTTLTLTDLSRCDELDHAVAQSMRGGSSCFTRESSPSCQGSKPPVCYPPHYNPCPPVHFGCGPVYTPVCHPQPGHIVPL
ncbi:hypothetical protein [Paraburkholderia susongensis]|uniref:Uncharacterized protein n=1 Tax=Paraburkholderia susongensis TaxID=1515439 RepID=A0A1X7LRF9_9BURK|nr:hypothetical protein [Paraburkholderia susongensis]SMG56496.1 hypothetical protein SAMN06265784_108198 [Paraburkholderia susongensis]